jgi:hypothetical protein
LTRFGQQYSSPAYLSGDENILLWSILFTRKHNKNNMTFIIFSFVSHSSVHHYHILIIISFPMTSSPSLTWLNQLLNKVPSQYCYDVK